uniref:Uncharacterized protein n=1 Tax=Cannabis sativa TaxID=3483 RepID=A0A803PKS2_CANSA
LQSCTSPKHNFGSRVQPRPCPGSHSPSPDPLLVSILVSSHCGTVGRSRSLSLGSCLDFVSREVGFWPLRVLSLGSALVYVPNPDTHYGPAQASTSDPVSPRSEYPIQGPTPSLAQDGSPVQVYGSYRSSCLGLNRPCSLSPRLDQVFVKVNSRSIVLIPIFSSIFGLVPAWVLMLCLEIVLELGLGPGLRPRPKTKTCVLQRDTGQGRAPSSPSTVFRFGSRFQAPSLDTPISVPVLGFRWVLVPAEVLILLVWVRSLGLVWAEVSIPCPKSQNLGSEFRSRVRGAASKSLGSYLDPYLGPSLGFVIGPKSGMGPSFGPVLLVSVRVMAPVQSVSRSLSLSQVWVLVTIPAFDSGPAWFLVLGLDPSWWEGTEVLVRSLWVKIWVRMSSQVHVHCLNSNLGCALVWVSAHSPKFCSVLAQVSFLVSGPDLGLGPKFLASSDSSQVTVTSFGRSLDPLSVHVDDLSLEARFIFS